MVMSVRTLISPESFGIYREPSGAIGPDDRLDNRLPSPTRDRLRRRMVSSLRVLARTRPLYGADGSLDSRCSYRRGDQMNRRTFITLLGGAGAVWPLTARAQEAAMPVVGYVRSTTAAGVAHFEAALRQGLNEAGFVEGQNVAVEYHYADDRADRLSALIADLVRRPVNVIVGNLLPALAAKAATATVPIVFVTGTDPVRDGLVASLNRPGGNVTGVSFLVSTLGAKRLELLHQL